MRDKVDPYLRPLYDALYDMMQPERVERDLEQGVIEVAPLAFMRGRTLANSIVILDEAQNTSSMQMKMFLTRLGENSKMNITGDPTQIDLPFGMTSGLEEAVRLLSDVPGLRPCASRIRTSCVAILLQRSSRLTTKPAPASPRNPETKDARQ